MPEENGDMQARLQKAGAYFEEKLGKEMLPLAMNIQILTDNKIVRKTTLESLEVLQKEIFIKNACFVTVRDGFSAARYIRAKADAELDFRAAKAALAPQSDRQATAPKNTPHPALYVRLKKWREDVAETVGLEPYEVLPTRALLELVQFLPLNLPALKKIKGIGAGKSQRFGADLIAIIQNYCTEHRIETGQMTALADAALAEKAPKTDTKTVSFEMFKAGKTIDEIAGERGFVHSTIEGHLAHFVGLGELDIYTLMSREQVQEIEDFFREHNTQASAEAKAHFGEKYSYGQIKMVLQYMNAEEQGKAPDVFRKPPPE